MAYFSLNSQLTVMCVSVKIQDTSVGARRKQAKTERTKEKESKAAKAATKSGQPLKPLAKIISGGEMSRFMLALKLITGDLGNIGTMIFDEVDTGISGTVGQSVAKKLCRLSRARQVLCVTHLPQIAAMADSHFYIEKTDDGNETHTRVTALDRNGQIGEVARLSGTKGVSSTAMRNAEEIKDFCDEYKRSAE